MSQKIFSAHVKFTPDGWYQFGKEDEKAAMQARNAFAKELKAQGFMVRRFSISNQLLTFGGIGTNHPQIEVVTTCYGVNWR